MAQIQGVEIAKCSSCGKPIGDQNPYAWCVNCGEPLPEEVKGQIPRLSKPQSSASVAATTASSKPQQFNQSQSGDGLVSAMQAIGWGNLIASVILAFIIFVNFGTAEVTRGSYYPYTEKATNPIAVGTSIGVVVQGIIVLVFCLSLARILEYVSDIRSRLNQMLPKDKDAV